MSEMIKESFEKGKDTLSKMTDSLGLTDSQNAYKHSMLHEKTLNNPNYPSNNAVVFQGGEKVEVKNIGYPEFITPSGDPCPTGAILKVIASCICGSDLHMYRDRTSITAGCVFGHEITGIVCEVGPHVEIIKVGDVVSVPFNISCGLCDTCKQGKTNLCLRVNKQMPGGGYGYAEMGGWQGGQAQYVLVPYADWNLMQLPREHIKDKILDFALLTDVLPTSTNACYQANVGLGSTVYIAGAGPIGLGCVIASFMLGASHVIVGDFLENRLKLAQNLGAKTINLGDKKFKGDIVNDGGVLQLEIKELIGVKEVDCAIDCVGYEAGEIGQGTNPSNNPEQVLNTCMALVGAGGCMSFPGVFLPMDPKGPDSMHRKGFLPLRIGHSFTKAINLVGGQCPVMKYNKKLLKNICANRMPSIAKAFNIKVISFNEVSQAYKSFNEGEACKYIIDCNGFLSNPSLIEQEIKRLNPNWENDKDLMHRMTPS